MDVLPPLAQSAAAIILEYLPPSDKSTSLRTPFVTLTYAQLIDSKIAAEPGTRTTISSPETKTITHYLRSQHDAVLVGAGTARADDPKLSCRFDEHKKKYHPVPVILDPMHTWSYSRLLMQRTYEMDAGKAPIIIASPEHMPLDREQDELAADGGRYIVVPCSPDVNYYWQEILVSLARYGVRLLMVEGGARVINDLLPLPWVDSLIITVGPVFLGDKGVSVSPNTPVLLKDVKWWTSHRDLVMCARIKRRSSSFLRS